MRIRRYMEDDDELLKGIVEADELILEGSPDTERTGKLRNLSVAGELRKHLLLGQ